MKTVMSSGKQAPQYLCLKPSRGQWETEVVSRCSEGSKLIQPWWRTIPVKITNMHTLIRQTHLWKFIFCIHQNMWKKICRLCYSLQCCFLKDSTQLSIYWEQVKWTIAHPHHVAITKVKECTSSIEGENTQIYCWAKKKVRNSVILCYSLCKKIVIKFMFA